MKKIVVALGSPRKNGNSAMLADKAIAGIEAAGGSHEVFYLNGMKIRPCQACDSCRRDKERGCIVKDDMQDVYPKLKEADALLIATPIYMFSVTAQTKLFMDRFYSCLDVLKGKKVGILITYGDDDPVTSGVVNAVNMFKDQYNYMDAEIAGVVHASASKPGEIASNAKVMNEAFELGKKLAGGSRHDN